MSNQQSIALLMILVLVPAIQGQQQQPISDASLPNSASDWPVGDPRRCLELARQDHFPLKRFEVVPGIGWDNLRNVEAGMVISNNFTRCKSTDDGTFLIPDSVFTVPIKTSQVQQFAEMIDSWREHSSMTSNSVNVEAGLSLSFMSISGRFSWEHTKLRTTQVENKAVTVRVQLRYHRYESKLQPDPVLSTEFRTRLLTIAALVELNQTEMARYEGQLIVRDFGTHVLTSVTAGAALAKDDYLKRDFLSLSTTDTTTIMASASASFFDLFSFSASYTHSTSKTSSSEYTQQTTQSFTNTFGGPVFRPNNMTVDQWAAGVDANLVAMDRSGEPIYNMITRETLPELPPTTAAYVQQIVREAVEMYYEINVHPGCTTKDIFDFVGNFEDPTCTSTFDTFSFGGVYQTCTVSGEYLHNDPCVGVAQVNPKTNNYSCPTSYKSVQIHSATKTTAAETVTTCDNCWSFFHCCRTVQRQAQAVYKTFWCAPTESTQQRSGYMFGGIYTDFNPNPITGMKTCPANFYPRRLFTDTTICLSDDFDHEASAAINIPFGGFFSCEAGNPLSVKGMANGNAKKETTSHSLSSFFASHSDPRVWPAACPNGYSRHLLTVVMGCPIHYCVHSPSVSAQSSSKTPAVKRPPFMSKPVTLIDTDKNLAMFDIDSKTWLKNQEAEDFLKRYTTIKASLVVQTQKAHAEESLSTWTVAGITAGVVVACVVVIVTIAALVHRRRRRARGHSLYRRINDENYEPRAAYGAADP